MFNSQTPATQPRSKRGKLVGIGAASVLVVAIATACVDGSGTSPVPTSSVAAVSQAATPEAAAPEAATPAAPEVAAPVQEQAVPKEYKSALRQAKTYSDMMHMSKAGLYEQLTSEYGGQFTAEAAQYAIDNVEADWNANALEKAKAYEEMALSPSAIYDQLTSAYGEQFTPEEAQYAVDNL
ncbi:Host cell surface-exposed lipoprotein [Corynebacterium atrinae]|uniref:Ltp family lipoprotein n=1 Tax=Corynebacterium atrinae TaxID=1336740 RepID=UPI0025B3D0EE|nr:Ltp family lipoprotein [Corynebacterium atrinae]WJY63705.1 Host cell surface-exposed lipoprotein [Corynebacterium atrinae]